MFEETFSKYSLQSKMADFNRLRRNKNVNPRNQIVSLLVVALIAGSSFFFAKRITSPVHVAQKSQAATSSSDPVTVSASGLCTGVSGVISNCSIDAPSPVLPDPNNVCEANKGDKVNCEKAGCQYYADTKSCVIKGYSNICSVSTGFDPSCDNRPVGSACTTTVDVAKGVCGHSSVYLNSTSACDCKAPNSAIYLTDNGTYCPKNSGGCMCNSQRIPAGSYCALYIRGDEYCKESVGCLCTDVSGYTFTIASGVQCKVIPAGLKQWVDRTNGLRKSCAAGTSSPTECAGLGLYQVADIVTLGQLSATNNATEAYITCTQQLIAGTRTDCLKEAIALGANATFVADAFVGIAKLIVKAPQIVSESVQSLASVISPYLTEELVTSQGVITKELFGAHYDELLKICGNCDNPVDLYTFLREEKVALAAGDGVTPWGNVEQSGGTILNLNPTNSALPVGGDGVILFDFDYATETAVQDMYKKINLVPRQFEDLASTFANLTEKTRIQLVVHGSPNSVVYKGTTYNAYDFADLLKNNGFSPDIVESIDLISCNTAQSCSILQPSFAERLSTELGVPVTAPTTQAVYVPSQPNSLAVTANPDGSLQFGVWQTFYP